MSAQLAAQVTRLAEQKLLQAAAKAGVTQTIERIAGKELLQAGIVTGAMAIAVEHVVKGAMNLLSTACQSAYGFLKEKVTRKPAPVESPVNTTKETRLDISEADDSASAKPKVTKAPAAVNKPGAVRAPKARRTLAV